MARVPFLLKEGLEVEEGASIIGDLGIGTTTPLNLVDVSKSAGSAEIAAYSWSTTPTNAGTLLLGHSNHATLANYTALDADDMLGAIQFTGSNGSAFVVGAKIEAYATETFSGSARGSEMRFSTTDATTTTNDIRMTIDHNGNIGIGNDDPQSKLHVTGTVQVGVDNVGHDVYFYGATTGSFLLWDESDDALELTDSSPIKIGDNGDMQIYHDGDSYISNAVGALNIAIENSGIAVQIGHGTSTVTIGDNLTVTDTITELSMREMKTNIEPIENILPSVLQMQGVQFDWKKDEDKGLTNYGFIAEDVDKILPNLVSHDEEGKAQGIQYSKMTAVLLEAIKEQQVQIEELKSKIN